MSGARRVAVTAAAALMVALFLCPPFMVIDTADARNRHAALGHHPRWAPPAPASAERHLTARFGPPPGRESALRVSVNRVRLGAEMTSVALATAAAWAGLRAVGKRKR